MKTFYFFAFMGALLLMGACKEDDPQPDCSLMIPAQARLFEFAHRGSDYTFRAWTSDTAVIARVEAQLALAEEDRTMHINGEILEQPESCNLNPGWSWYFKPDGWDLAELSIELCDGNPQYMEENLEDYLNIDRYCPWSSYVLLEVE